MLQRAMVMARLASWQWTHPDDSRVARTLCPPETLIEMGLPKIAAKLTGGPEPST
jgi:hypothetical protein